MDDKVEINLRDVLAAVLSEMQLENSRVQPAQVFTCTEIRRYVFCRTNVYSNAHVVAIAWWAAWNNCANESELTLKVAREARIGVKSQGWNLASACNNWRAVKLKAAIRSLDRRAYRIVVEANGPCKAELVKKTKTRKK
jgi:hypothetical protein